ncbi:Eukaryotic translation initiation factor 2B, subunit 4 delta, 67kDa [Blyttiomyces sp. JEL0837]|nr:Eukaryotic translation initiation factor 2B, subunit 4 delta, 67kDa [Blyttiomyces sp. JEL0837]
MPPKNKGNKGSGQATPTASSSAESTTSSLSTSPNQKGVAFAMTTKGEGRERELSAAFHEQDLQSQNLVPPSVTSGSSGAGPQGIPQKRPSMSGIRGVAGISRSPARASLEETMMQPVTVGAPAAVLNDEVKEGEEGGKENDNAAASAEAKGDPSKKKAKEMTKAERRELQERQRAEKAAQRAEAGLPTGKGGAQKPKQESNNVNASPNHDSSARPSTANTNAAANAPTSGQGSGAGATMAAAAAAGAGASGGQRRANRGPPVRRQLAQKPVALLSHLQQYEKGNVQLDELRAQGIVHPAIIKLGMQFSEFVISGGSARCLAMLTAFKMVISDYVTPAGNSLQRHLTSHLGKQIDYLTTTRTLADSMRTAIRHIKSEITGINIDMPDEDAKDHLKQWIDDYIREKITFAATAIVQHAMNKIKDGDVILTFARSSVVEKLLLAAHAKGIKFRVIVCDSRPKLEGKIQLKRLVDAGIPCTYIFTNALGVVMREVTKLVIGASALLANGAVMARAVLCELYKFTEAVRLDSFVWNEIGDPDELVDIENRPPTAVTPSLLSPPGSGAHGGKKDANSQPSILKEWRDIPDLKLLHLYYDVTPANFIDLVICENGCQPSTSVLSTLNNLEREKREGAMQCDPTTFIITDVRTLILLLASPDPPTCIAATEALTKIAEVASAKRVQLLNLNILKPLMGLTSSKEVGIKKAAVACIAAVTELNELHPDMRKKELIDTLIGLLALEEPPEVQDEAAFALANLAKDFANKADIRKAGGMKALVKLLDAADPDVKKNSALALASVLEDFSNRSEIRYVNGLASLLELLGSEFQEIQENALISLIHSAEDYANRTEIRKLNGVKRLIDLLAQDLPELHHLTLMCLANCLEEPETASIFPEIGGLGPVIKLLGSEDVRSKRNASLAIARAAKIDRNQNYIRDCGALTVLVNNLGHSDPGTVSHAALALASLAKNDMNQLELFKMGATDSICKLLASEDADICRQSVLACSSLCLNREPKVRSKIKLLDAIGPIIKLLASEDPQTLINTCECISNLAEDTANRCDIVKQGGVLALLASLGRPDPKIQSAASLALARCFQDAEARAVLSKDKKFDGIGKLIAMLGAKDLKVARQAAYALSYASQYEPNALAACQQGAIEALIALIKDPVKNASKFATDALDKLLNYNLSAKYWLKNVLSAENFVREGFYDVGSAGTNLENIKRISSLADLKIQPVDKRREVLMIESETDTRFISLCQQASLNLSLLSPRQQIIQIATTVANAMGGSIEPTRLAEFSYKFKVTELKLKQDSNVLAIGQITSGTFYHRALLFKAICDRIGISPCSLTRGEYNRAWNVVDVNKLVLQPVPEPQTNPEPAPGPTAGAGTATGPAAGGKTNASPQQSAAKRPPSAATKGVSQREPSISGAGNAAAAASAAAAAAAAAALAAASASVQQGTPVHPGSASGAAAKYEPPLEPSEPMPEEPVIVDLMFQPGRLIPISSDEGSAYQRG